MYDIQNVRHTKMYDIQKYMTYMCRYISSGCVLKYDVMNDNAEGDESQDIALWQSQCR
jgi:hypothetical protein